MVLTDARGRLRLPYPTSPALNEEVVGVLDRHLVTGPGRGRHEPRSAAAILGADHPLARALDLIGVLRRQSAATGLVIVGSAFSLALGADWAQAALTAAVAVELVVVAVLAAVVALRGERVRDLLIEGRDVPLPVVARERRRLLAQRRRDALAGALEDLVRSAERRVRPRPGSRPVCDVVLVRQVASELRAIASDLRSANADVRGVARVERLLTTGASPLYGREVEALRVELARIVADLACSGGPGEEAYCEHGSIELEW